VEYLIITEDAGFKHPVYGEGVLKKGKTYYTYSQFARETAERGLGRIVKEKKPCVIPFKQSHLGAGERFNKILLIFAGGLGDAVTCGTVLPEIMKVYGLRFDICCDKMKWDAIFKPMGMPGHHVPYPPDLETLERYEAVLSDITSFFHSSGAPKHSPVAELLRGFGIRPGPLNPTYKIPDAIREKSKLTSTDSIRIGINFDSNGLVKSYPETLQPILLQRLEALGFDLFLFGVKGYRQEGYGLERIHDLRGKTSIPELAALLEQMDLLIGVDSFIAHLADLLGIPSLVMLSTTPKEYFKYHKNVTFLSSGLECAPWYSVFDKCPIGNEECQAFYHDGIVHGKILKTAFKILSESLGGKLKGQSAA